MTSSTRVDLELITHNFFYDIKQKNLYQTKASGEKHDIFAFLQRLSEDWTTVSSGIWIQVIDSVSYGNKNYVNIHLYTGIYFEAWNEFSEQQIS